ncbi:MAG: hypothetical protein JJU48_04790 [Methylophaga sp.]|nr:hypothetical protein [Methylophaga sp.]
MTDKVIDEQAVLSCTAELKSQLKELLGNYGIDIVSVDPGQSIPGSFFGEREAGLIGHQLFVRDDTPVHSALHEACHYICMDKHRRSRVDTDAEGDYDEENAVCYLQILLSDKLPSMGSQRMLLDMDRWGYSFRLGSAAAWFKQDAEDARQWLQTQQLIDKNNAVTGRLRQ